MSRQLSVHLPDEARQRLEATSKAEGRSLSSVVRRALEQSEAYDKLIILDLAGTQLDGSVGPVITMAYDGTLGCEKRVDAVVAAVTGGLRARGRVAGWRLGGGVQIDLRGDFMLPAEAVSTPRIPAAAPGFKSPHAAGVETI